MSVGITIRQVGIGDGVQFTSLPENYFRKTGNRLIDVSEPWYLEHNPFVIRNETPERTIELWNYPPKYEWPKLRNTVYQCNAEVHTSIFGIRSPPLIRPRLYRFEEFPFEQREMILFHPYGKSHGALPDFVIEHVLKKYKPTKQLVQIGLPTDPDLGIPRIFTGSMWELAELCSQAKMFIGVDSGPSWVAACYPDVQIKKVRTKFQFGYSEPYDWVALDVNNPHSFWDDRMFQIHNITEDDVGFTQSYKRL